ncbi:MAG TPA: DUF72 domain-containing protein [Micrococcaceae bacterium]
MGIYIGTSGWSYDHWRGVLYPPGVPAARWLEYYSSRFGTVELNGSFYRWPRPAAFEGWRQRLPAGFLLSVKAPRGLTHAKKLADPLQWIGRISQSLEALDGMLASLLVQLPPDLERDDGRLEVFLAALPDWIHATVEFRHPSWIDDDVFALLEEHRASYCIMSGPGLPCVLRATAELVYLRLHGPDTDPLYAGSYSDQELGVWAQRIRDWDRAGHLVCVYFNNDGGGNAVRNAVALQDLLGSHIL